MRRLPETLTLKTMKTTRAEVALRRILSTRKNIWAPERGNSFKSLIRTVLSQNTNWRNEEAAYRRLAAIGITPQALSAARLSEIVEAIRPAGMYNQRSRVIQLIAEDVIRRFNGDLAAVVSKPYEEARETLMSLPGVGEKTADVVLLFSVGKNVLPIDRHIVRISKRLDIVPSNAKYDDIRYVLEKSVKPKNYLDAHITLIQFGRDTCRALNPKCPQCILEDICPYPKKRNKKSA